MKKMFKKFRGLVVLSFLLISTFSFSKMRISGNLNIWFDSTSHNSNNKTYKAKKYVGNMDDREFEERAFIIKRKGYSFLSDSYGNKLLLQVEFNSSGEVIQETLYYTNRFTNNCIGVKGDNSFCFTITKDGIPSIWDRYNSRYVYFGTFVNVRINNPYKDSIRYDDDNIFEF